MNRREVILGAVSFGLYGEGVGRGAEAKEPAVPKSRLTGWPDVSNTGVPSDTKLAPSKALTIDRDGVVIESLDIDGMVNVNASNVTLRRCRIRVASFWVVKIQKGATGVTVEDCEIDGVGSNNDGSNGILGSGVFQRNNIFNVENGVTLDGGAPTVIMDNYIHDLLASGSPHYDCIQIDGNVSDVVIRHNTAINDYIQTSAVMIDNGFGPISNILVENNLLIGGAFTIYVDGQFNASPITNVRILYNHMGTGHWGVNAFNKTAPVFEGNVNDGLDQLKSLRRTIKASSLK